MASDADHYMRRSDCRDIEMTTAAPLDHDEDVHNNMFPQDVEEGVLDIERHDHRLLEEQTQLRLQLSQCEIDKQRNIAKLNLLAAFGDTRSQLSAKKDITMHFDQTKTNDGVITTVTFPDKSRRYKTRSNLLKLAQTHVVMYAALVALCTGVDSTIRDVYYGAVELFGNQTVVVVILDNLARTWGLNRFAFGINAAPRSLIAGAGWTAKLRDGQELNMNQQPFCFLPPAADVWEWVIKTSVKWVLIVEKHAIFDTLVRIGITTNSKMPGEGILVTGLGFPDIALQTMLSMVSKKYPNLSINALMDCDVGGLRILSVYQNGSENLRHENLGVATPINHIGMHLSELSDLGINWMYTVKLSEEDYKRVEAMLKNKKFPDAYRAQLELMKAKKRKAEIEILKHYKAPSGMHPYTAYISDRMSVSASALAGHPQLGIAAATVASDVAAFAEIGLNDPMMCDETADSMNVSRDIIVHDSAAAPLGPLAPSPLRPISLNRPNLLRQYHRRMTTSASGNENVMPLLSPQQLPIFNTPQTGPEIDPRGRSALAQPSYAVPSSSQDEYPAKRKSVHQKCGTPKKSRLEQY